MILPSLRDSPSTIDSQHLSGHERRCVREEIDHCFVQISGLPDSTVFEEQAGKPHETLILQYGMHYLNVERERIKFFEKLEDFLARCMTPVAAEAS